ncbi:bacterioferritin-associated ferredoxin-like protein [Reyranella sp. CPCC 100927]|nr:bacterioferritin-associated ferredoxin-like protein [Reyranella sp. CPCC 100927]
MYVCICNAVNERAVRDAIGRGCRTVGEVYRSCGARPQCGKCGIDIARCIQQQRRETSSDSPWPLAAE